VIAHENVKQQAEALLRMAILVGGYSVSRIGISFHASMSRKFKKCFCVSARFLLFPGFGAQGGATDL